MSYCFRSLSDFEGTIPPGFGKLSMLKHLHLARNRLSGEWTQAEHASVLTVQIVNDDSRVCTRAATAWPVVTAAVLVLGSGCGSHGRSCGEAKMVSPASERCLAGLSSTTLSFHPGVRLPNKAVSSCAAEQIRELAV